jgi:hypothetical protein
MHIKHKNFHTGDLVLFYDNKVLYHPGKLHMHWLGPYVIIFLKDVGVLQLEKLNEEVVEILVNGSRLKQLGS